MREEYEKPTCDLVGEGNLAGPVEFEPRPSKFLTYALASGLTAGLYWIYIQSILFIREELRFDTSSWHYRIAGSGLTIGLVFYIVAILLPLLYLRPISVVNFLQRSIQETISFCMKVWNQRQSLKRWDEKTRKLQNTEETA